MDQANGVDSFAPVRIGDADDYVYGSRSTIIAEEVIPTTSSIKQAEIPISLVEGVVRYKMAVVVVVVTPVR